MQDVSCPPSYAAIILAAGSGHRAQGSSPSPSPKQYSMLNNRAIVEYSLKTFLHSQLFSRILLVIAKKDSDLCLSSIDAELYNQVEIVYGGETRQSSSRQALLHLAEKPCEYVVIHDAARPFVSLKNIQELLDNTTLVQGASLAVPVSDSIKKANGDGFVLKSLSRETLYAAQTPQAFPFKKLYAAHQAAIDNSDYIFTDDSSIAENYGLTVKLVAGSLNNIKITWPEDFARAEIIARQNAII